MKALSSSLCEDVQVIEFARSQMDESFTQVKKIGGIDKDVKFSANTISIVKLWIAFIITIGFCAILLITAHISHSLTLRVEAYHSLYNLLSLMGCLLTMKLCSEGDSLKNTFGWARVELLSTLCTLLFLGSLCFGVAVDCIQTTAHAGHQDPMHHPVPIIALGGIGLFVNTLVFFLIGGYTHHQGCLLERKNSIVWVKQPTLKTSSKDSERLNYSQDSSNKTKSYQGIRGTLRDISGLIMVMICATIVLWDEGQILALYVDPAFAVLSASFLLFLSYPYGKECCQILLQTIPGHIDVQSLFGRLLRKFPEIVNVHHLHIWSLTPGKVIATVHVVFNNPGVYKRLSQELVLFFKEEEISKVTLQPEFVSLMESSPSTKASSCQCLLQCGSAECENKDCFQGCSDVANINIRDTPEINIIQDSMKNFNLNPSLRCKHYSSFTNIGVTTILEYEQKGNSLKNIMPFDNIKFGNTFNKLCKKSEKSTFHSLQDIRNITSTTSGRYGEYLTAFRQLRMKYNTNTVDQLL